MNYLFRVTILLFWSIIICPTCRAQVNWFTPEVGQQLGIEVSPGRSPGYVGNTQMVGQSRITSFTIAVFDTVATYVQGRVVNRRTGQPIAGAHLDITYRSLGMGCCEHRGSTTDTKGFFRVGWVGTTGPAGGRDNRILQIQAAGYPSIQTQKIEFGGAAYLHIELATNYPFTALPSIAL